MDFSDSYGTHIPARKSLVATAKKLQSGPGAKAAEFVGSHGFANDIMWSGSLGDTYSAAISNVVVQGQDPVQAFAGFADLAATELAKLLVVLADDHALVHSVPGLITDLDHFFEFLGGMSASVAAARGESVPTLVTDTTGRRVHTATAAEASRAGLYAQLLNP